MKSKELKSYNLPGDLVITEIDAKPRLLFIGLMLLGILALVAKFSTVYGVMLIGIGLCCICFMPSSVLMEFYHDYLVMYNKADKNTCEMIYYDEIKSWYYSWGTSKDFLIIELEDGRVEKIEAFSKAIFEGTMSLYCKDKKIKKTNENSRS